MPLLPQRRRLVYAMFLAEILSIAANSRAAQQVEGFDAVEFHNGANGSTPTQDFRGMSRGYMTAGWWIPGQADRNYVSWKTAVVPEKADTKFVFVGATSPLPSELSRGPTAKISVNGKHAVAFTIGANQNHTWSEGDFELKYTSKRVEFPYFGAHRELRELHGNSGLFELSVPASVLEAGKPATIKVELLPFKKWGNGWFMVKERRDTLTKTIESLEGEVESLRRDVAVLNQQTQMLATRQYSELTGTDRFEHFVIHQDGYRHLHPADLIRLKSGELLIMAREGTEHISNDGDVIMLRSSDDGKTWTDKQTIAGIENLDEREGCGLQLSDGSILVGVFYNSLYDDDGVYKGPKRKAVSERSSDGRNDLGAYIIKSTDDGKTWSAPKYVDTTGMPFKNIEGPTDAPIEMPDGSALMAVIGYSINGDTKNTGAVMLRSTDKGESWKYLATIAGDPGGKLGGFFEPGIVRTKSGRIVAGLRSHGIDKAIWIARSDDDGKTWSPPRMTEMIGHPADLLQLRDGRLLCSYGVRTEHALPEGVRACFSHDDGSTWDTSSETQLRSDFRNWDIGYPESIELADGRLLTVYYGNLFGKYFLAGTYWKPAQAKR
jgi:sialidase-1